ncbi:MULTISPECIES: BREX-1 system adenine-specific DNA-methyltransferase PglX [Oscillospiraceae]|uniref:BREX-1 system adenine-specific DNA-methyltransferase PglX n=1 Tax=Oscillospiraceae TaxID=216572 RepID=UPI0011062147|nr:MULTISPECIES: BREX-1 system adenine-specific DNA-methyltransferase PglX [Oscillospiraceae]
MDKNAIKKYAVWARKELIARVTQKAEQYEITEKKTAPADADSIGGRVLTVAEKKQRQALIAKINQDGFEQVMEEVAYTWFNRFTALRFMEVNNYLPSHTRVFTNENGEFKPQILADAIQLDLEGLNMDKVFELKDANKTEELYKYLLITQCNALSGILPRMFQKIEDYTELLLPDYLLREGSVIEQMIALIPEEDWTDQVQIIGWLYQFYIAEPKERLINARKQYSDKDIATVTELFTPDWIVRYMVENALGRFWLNTHYDANLKISWKYYLESKNDNNFNNGDGIKPEDILAIDPCQGSGHILAYMFDVFVQIYESYGYSARDAASSIVKYNLFGLDIDERATQLAYFSIMMKARQYDRRFFTRDIQPNVYSIVESNNIDKDLINYFIDGREDLKSALHTILKEMKDAREFGAILNISEVNFEALNDRIDEIENEKELSFFRYQVHDVLIPLINVAEIMSKKYHVVVTNPPYMNSTYMPEKLRAFIQENYADYKSDLFSVFIAKILSWCRKDGQIGLLTPYVWMFILSYEKLRVKILHQASITSMVQLEYNAFEGATVPVCGFTLHNSNTGEPGEYIRLSDFKGIDVQEPKTLEAIKNPECGYRYTTYQLNYQKIPGRCIAYWLSDEAVSLFEKGILLSEYADLKQGLITGDNNRFLRFWQECDSRKISVGGDRTKKWYFYHKGGEYRKWYGNINLVVNWENNGEEIINFRDDKGKQKSRPQNVKYYLREGFTWTALTIADFNVRYMPSGCIFDAKGSSGFINKDVDVRYFIGLCNSKVAMEFLSFLAPTMDYNAGAVGKLPVLIDDEKKSEIISLVDECISISREDWDAFEISWDYKKSPLIRNTGLISEAYRQWSEECDRRFSKLKENEEHLNDIFIHMYGFESIVDSSVKEENVTVRKADLKREIKGLISYAVGCMFGRYSLDEDGLIYAGGEWNPDRYKSYMVDQDNIIPICDDEYFNDDIVERFVDFIRTAYGDETLDENLRYIAKGLGGSENPKQVIRKYFNDSFYRDHCDMYQVPGSGKRPIYWLFDSGRKNGFKCLIYMHRYKADIIARIRTDYVHEQQSRYRTAISDLEQRNSGVTSSERVTINKRLQALQDQAAEIREYEEKIHHLADQMISIDLDDGFKENYSRFQDVLAKVK